MLITRKNWKYDVIHGEGTVNITPEDSDDIWALYNLISLDDHVECMTLRKVLQENSAGDVVDSHKMKMILAVQVEKVDIDLKAACLRINGRNIKENPHVKLGSYHTLDVEPDRWLKLTKHSWDALSIELLDQALNSMGRTEIGALVMQEGLAHVCTVSPSIGIKVLQKVEVSQPKKKMGPTSASEKAHDRFLEAALEAMIKNIRFDALKAVIIAGPDGLRDELYKKLIERAQRDKITLILENKGKFIRIAVTSGQPAALADVLKEPRIAAILADTKTAKETRALDVFHKLHGQDADRTTFGPDHVKKAAEEGAVRQLLLSDSLFRSLKVQQRKWYAELINTVKENGGEVLIFSSGSPPDQDLQKLGGVAATLNFPLEI